VEEGLEWLEVVSRSPCKDKSNLLDCECAADISKASIRPGVTMMLHSSGWIVSQEFLSDQKKMEAIVLVALLGCAGTLLKGACEAD
jgi:hypothetical protein